MEPLHPRFREALKKVHRGLTDHDIDRFEELLAQRFLLDPEKDRERIIDLDREREKLVRETLPYYQVVWQRFQDEQKGQARRKR